jgi:hypothetical protein
MAAGDSPEEPPLPSTPEDLAANQASALSARQRAILERRVAQSPGALAFGEQARQARDQASRIQVDLAAGRVVAAAGSLRYTTRSIGPATLVELVADIPGQRGARPVLGPCLPGPARLYLLPTAEVVVGVEPDPRAHAQALAAYRAMLLALLGIGEEDIALNRAGSLSPRQRGYVLSGGSFGIGVAIGIFGLVVGLLAFPLGVAGLFDRSLVSSPMTLLVVGLAMLILLGGGGLALALRERGRSARASVAPVEGPARVAVMTGDDDAPDGTPRTTYVVYLRIGERSFRVDHLTSTGALSVLIPGRIHRAWVEPRSEAVVALEAL